LAGLFSCPVGRRFLLLQYPRGSYFSFAWPFGCSVGVSLTSQSAKEFGAVDPKAQIMADEAKGKELQQKEESAAPKKKVTSRMLLNKFHRDQER